MNVFTLSKRLALVAVLAASTCIVNAQTFVVDGIIYKVASGALTVQKTGTKLTTDQTAPEAYTGDIVIPATVEYGGKTYKVNKVASAFKGTEITSIVLSDNIVELARGAFADCVQLKTAVLGNGITKVNGDVFSGCTALTEISIPACINELPSNFFKGTKALQRVTFEASETPIKIVSGSFFDGGTAGLEELNINRPVVATDVATAPFRGAPALKTINLGGKIVELPSNYFENCIALKTVNFYEGFTTLGTNVFAGSGLEEIALPATLTAVPASTFQACTSLKKVTLGDQTKSIGAMAFYLSTLSEINFPASLTSIGQMAFSGTKLSGDLAFAEGLTSIGIQAFANNTGVTSFTLPSTMSSIGDGAFMGCTSVAKFTASGDAFASTADGAILASADGKTLIACAPAHATTELKGAYETILPYAAYGAKNLATIELPAATTYGDYALAGTSVAKYTINGTIGRYVLANSAKLADLTIGGKEVPYGIAANCPALANVTFTGKITTVKQDAFLNCSSVKALDFGTILAILEADAFKGCGVETITVGAANPAAMAAGVFTEANSNITVKVPVEYVDAYKSATGWSLLNIVGDANVAAGPNDMGMPNGLYYANPDGKIYCAYADGQSDEYDLGGVYHTFQLTQFKNRIYGASAGKKFVYSNTGSVDGDGKLFYLSQIGGQNFQAVVLDNTGNNAYKDPFGLYIYGDTLFVNDRNVCIRKIAADAIALSQDYPSWVENNWLGYYGAPWAYGCIKAGWAITQSENAKGEPEPLYWVGMKYAGNGIYCFKDEHVGVSSGNPGARPSNMAYLMAINPIFTTFYIDEENQHMYIYIEKAGSTEENIVKGGLYRIDLEKLYETPDPSNFAELGAILVDGSPVKWEGSSTNEHVGISQLSPDEDGKYLYWCYRAPSADEAAANEAQDFTTMQSGKYWWADKYDAENPLHQTGIKRIKLGEAEPKVEMVVPGAEGYGVVPVKYEGSNKPEGVKDIVAPAAKSTLIVNGDLLTASEAAEVYVYNMAGTIVGYGNLAAGESLSIADLAKGAYVATANGAALKFVK